MVGGISYKVAEKAQVAGLGFFINFALIVDTLSQYFPKDTIFNEVSFLVASLIFLCLFPLSYRDWSKFFHGLMVSRGKSLPRTNA